MSWFSNQSSTDIIHSLKSVTEERNKLLFIHGYSCSSLLCTFCFCRVYVSGISSCPVHPVFFSLNKSVQFSSVLTTEFYYSEIVHTVFLLSVRTEKIIIISNVGNNRSRKNN